MPCSKTVKGICCLISAICTHLILGNAYTWANINVYYVSYVRINNPSFTLMDGFFMVPILMFVNYSCIMPSGYAEKYTGPRLFSIAGFLLALLAHVFLYFFTQYWVIMLSMALFGCGFGIAYFPVLKTTWKYFPKKKGLVTGVVLCCIGFSTFLFTSLADYIINPENKAPTNGYFEEEIAKRTKDFIFIMIFIILGLGVISNCLIFPYTEDDIILANANQDNTTSHYVQKERVKEAVRSKQFYLLGTFVVGNLFVGFLITNTNRTFGSVNEIDQTLLQMLSKVYALLNGVLRVAWGFIYDKVNFRILYGVIIVNYLICIFSYYFCGQNPNGIAFFIINCFAVLSFSGNSTLFTPVLIHYFGIKNSIILSGFYYFVNGVLGLVSPIICKFFVKTRSDFLIIYMIGGSFSIASFIAFCLMKPEAYQYTWKSKREEEEEEIRQRDKDNIEKICINPLIKEASNDEALINNSEAINDHDEETGMKS